MEHVGGGNGGVNGRCAGRRKWGHVDGASGGVNGRCDLAECAPVRGVKGRCESGEVCAPIRELRRSNERSVGDGDAVVQLVPLLQPPENAGSRLWG